MQSVVGITFTHVRWRFGDANSVVLSVSRCLLSTYYVQGTLQGAWNGAVSKYKSVAPWSPVWLVM